MDPGEEVMSGKRFKLEVIVNKLREADVLLSQGKSVAQMCQQIGITDQICYPGLRRGGLPRNW